LPFKEKQERADQLLRLVPIAFGIWFLRTTLLKQALLVCPHQGKSIKKNYILSYIPISLSHLKSLKKTYLYLLFFLLFALLGFTREFFFVNLNNIMYMLYYHNTSSMPVPGIMKGFMNFKYESLYYSKYGFTLLCTALYFALSYWTLKKLTGRPFFTRVLSYAYLIFIVLSALSMLYGYFIKERLADEEYTLSRWLMGVLQSPIICLILVASERLYKPGEKD